MLKVKYIDSRDGIVQETSADKANFNPESTRLQLWKGGSLKMRIPVDDVVGIESGGGLGLGGGL